MEVDSIVQSILESSKKVLIIGRGPSSRFHVNFNTSNYLKVGLNFSGEGFDHTINIQNREADFKGGLRVGSTEFNLGKILDLLDIRTTEEKEIYLLGFDFNANTSDDDILKETRRNTSNLQRKIDIESQLIAFRNIKNALRNIRLKRIGFDSFSDICPKTLETRIYTNKVEIVAEVTTNHFGNSDRLEKLIEGAYRSGADSVKLQKRNVDTFYSKKELSQTYNSPFGKSFYDYRKALELTRDQIELAKSLCKKFDMGLFFSVLDIESYKSISSYGFNRIKLPSTISNKRDLLTWVSANHEGEVVISTGMTDQSYEEFILKNFDKASTLYLLQCISSYPTYYSDSNLAVIRNYAKLSHQRSNIVPGYSSHDIGSLGSQLAVAAGAKMIEKHIKTGVTNWAHFDDTALDVEIGFRDFCEDIRIAERYMGTGEKFIMDSEHHKY